MAVYTVPQDVEADDKFVGPLSFKQFIFIGIGAIAGYLSFLALKGFWPALVFT
ncbi:PrgI family protein, partial [bacterium]|nr:PrgI family protein [bacterium]